MFSSDRSLGSHDFEVIFDERYRWKKTKASVEKSFVVGLFIRSYLKEKGRCVYGRNTEKAEQGGALENKAHAGELHISSWQHPFVQFQSSKDEFWIGIKIYS